MNSIKLILARGARQSQWHVQGRNFVARSTIRAIQTTTVVLDKTVYDKGWLTRKLCHLFVFLRLSVGHALPNPARWIDLNSKR